MNYTLEELEKTWNFYDNSAKEIIDNAVDVSFKFINKDMLQRYEEYIENNNFEDNDDFNIFELMSDKFYRENFHSYIIAQLLKSEIILKNFLKFIKVDEIVYINNGYDVIPEYSIKHEIKDGRIDILIKSNDKENNEDEENKEKPHCIIIENKLHGAKDEERQLYRYFIACSEKFEVDKIVYLLPNLDKKNKPDEQSKEGIPKELIKIIVGYNGKNKDFHAVLNDSLEEVKSNSNIEWNLLLKHYLKILRLTGETKMDALTEKFYEKIKTEPEEYKKIQLIATMYNDLIKTRIDYFAKEFNGEFNYKDNYFIKYFQSKKRNTDYAIVIYMDNNWSWLQLFSEEERTATDDNPKSKKKWEQDNKDIEAWLKKHKLFDGFKQDENGCWAKEFKFSEEENKLYEFTKKLIKCLEEDVESIYNSGK